MSRRHIPQQTSRRVRRAPPQYTSLPVSPVSPVPAEAAVHPCRPISCKSATPPPCADTPETAARPLHRLVHIRRAFTDFLRKNSDKSRLVAADIQVKMKFSRIHSPAMQIGNIAHRRNCHGQIEPHQIGVGCPVRYPPPQPRAPSLAIVVDGIQSLARRLARMPATTRALAPRAVARLTHGRFRPMPHRIPVLRCENRRNRDTANRTDSPAARYACNKRFAFTGNLLRLNRATLLAEITLRVLADISR